MKISATAKASKHNLALLGSKGLSQEWAHISWLVHPVLTYWSVPHDSKEEKIQLPWVGKIPWRRKWQPTPVFLPGESHGQRSLEGYNWWATKSWTQLSTHTCSTIFIFLSCSAHAIQDWVESNYVFYLYILVRHLELLITQGLYTSNGFLLNLA